MSALKRVEENLKSYGLGRLLEKLANKQDKVVQAVRNTGKDGMITIKIKYKNKGANSMQVFAEVTAKVPEHAIPVVEMYANDDGLHDENPAQMDFENVHRLDDDRKTIHEV